MNHHLAGISVLGAGNAPAIRRLDNRPTRQDGQRLVASVLGGVVGYAAWKRHPILGLFVGSGIAESGVRLAHGENLPSIGSSIARLGGSTAGSLAWKAHPVLGWIGGAIATDLTLGAIGGDSRFREIAE